jgi:hypothetical protein
MASATLLYLLINMHLLTQLYRTRLTLLAVLLTAIGLGLLLLSHWTAAESHWLWLQKLPVSDVGSGLFTTGLLAVAWQYFTQEVADDHTMQLFRHVLKDEAPAIRDAVLRGFAFKPEDLARVASPATLDQIVCNALAFQLGDQALAADVYADLRRQVIQSPERRHNCTVAVDLAPWEAPTDTDASLAFVATVHCEYRVVPARTTMRFSCVSDQDSYRELLQDPTSALAWYFKPIADLHGGSDEAFQLVQFSVDGKPRPIRRSRQARGQSYVVNLPGKAPASVGMPATLPSQEVTISYTYRVLVRRGGHLLYLDVGTLTRGLKIAFRYGGCGIQEVTPLSFIASAEPPRVLQSPPSTPTPSVEVGFDGWVLPRSGVAFIWTLQDEGAPTPESPNTAANAA